MRLWSIHPSQLDRRALVAVWREALLAKAVLRGRTRGYRNHPQLARFRAHPEPVAAINAYLAHIHAEACRRGYRFDARKLRGPRSSIRIAVTRGQLRYEWRHLMRKLAVRAPDEHRAARGVQPASHPLFRTVTGGVAAWEVRPGPAGGRGHSGRVSRP